MDEGFGMIRRAGATLVLAALLLGCSLQQAASRQDPVNPHLLQGVAHERKGEWAPAMQEYALAAQTDPRGNFYLGNLLFQHNKLDEAEQEYRTALRTLHNDPALLNNLAWLLYTRKDKLEEAEQLAALAVKLSGPEHFVEYWDTLEQIRQIREPERSPGSAPAAK